MLGVWASNAVERGCQGSSPLWCTQWGIGKKCQNQNWKRKFLTSIWCCFPSMYFLASCFLIYSLLFSIFWCTSPLSPLHKESLSAFLPLNILLHAIGKILLFSYFSGSFSTHDREITSNCWKCTNILMSYKPNLIIKPTNYFWLILLQSWCSYDQVQDLSCIFA